MLKTLTNKVGPLPVWAYGAILGGVLGVWLWYFRFRGTTDETMAEDGFVSTDVPAEDALGDSGLGSLPSPYTSGALPGALGSALDVNELYSINPETGRPYIVDLNAPLNPETGLPWSSDYAAAIARSEIQEEVSAERARQLQEARDALAALQGQAAATPLPTMTAPAAPAAPATPTPTPAPVYLPTLGPWADKPNAATIASLQGRGYRVVRRGDGKWIAVDTRFHG